MLSNFEGVTVTPLEIIATQRTQYTHRKNRESKKIKQEIEDFSNKSKLTKAEFKATK